MNIAVIAPHANGNGVTTIASLLALELANRNRKVCLTHTAARSETLLPYFGITETSDSGIKSDQLLSLIRGGGIRESDVYDYCRTVKENLQVFSPDSDKMDDVGKEDIIRFICTKFEHDYVVIDADIKDLDHPVNKVLLRYCDCIVYVMSQRTVEAIRFRQESKKILARIGKVPHVVVVNQFLDIIGTTKALAAKTGSKDPGRWLTVRYNPWIRFGTENGQLLTLRATMDKRDYRVVDVDTDIRELANAILRVQRENLEMAQIRRERKKAKRARAVSETQRMEGEDE